MKKKKISKFHKRYDWKKVQAYYNKGNSTRETCKHFKMAEVSLTKKVKKGLFQTRTREDGIKLYYSKNPNRKHTQATKDKLSKIRKEYLTKNPDKVPYRLNHSSKESYPEKIFRVTLEKSDIKSNWIQEYQFGRFSFDFAFPDLMIDIEIDGETHTEEKVKEKDKTRDELTKSNGWTVIRFSAKQIRENVGFCIEKLKFTIIEKSTYDFIC